MTTKSTSDDLSYGFSVRLDVSCELAKDLVTEALRQEGFGVLTEIDVQRVLADNLGLNIAPYMVLGACNPELAHASLAADPNVGLLLPCNIVLRQEGHACVVSILDPFVIANVSKAPGLRRAAELARERLKRTIECLSDQSIE